MEEQTEKREIKKTAYNILSEIENQLQLTRRIAYDYSLEDGINIERRGELLGIHNILLDIEMKVGMLIEDDQLDTIKAPAALQVW